MIISRTPFRISLFGGGTDYPDWYRQHGGVVLSTTFDKYCYITCRELPPFFNHKYRLAYSIVENANNISDIKHPAIRGVLSEMNFAYGLEIHADADLPARSGLGSSSSFVVGMLHALKALRGERCSKKWLAKEAIRIEQDVLKENVGSQDQAAAAYGGLNIIRFSKDSDISVESLILPSLRKAELNDHMMLFFTGFSRIASEIAKSQIANLSSREKELSLIQKSVENALEILVSTRDIRELGAILDDCWMLKQSLSDQITNQDINSIYSKARKAGAIGGKLLGAGGGGFMLLFVSPKMQGSVRAALNGFVEVPFKFETAGSQIIHYEP